MKKLMVCLVAVLGVSAGSAQAGVLDYFKDRGNDVLDVFRARAGFPEHGRGVGVKARVTSLAQVGYVDFDGSYAGLERRGVGVVDEKRREGGVSLAYGSWNETMVSGGNQYLKGTTNWSVLEDRRIVRNLPHWDDGRRRPFSIGAELALPIGALDLGVYPEEFVDLVVGVTTLDMYNDDVAQDVEIPNAMPSDAPEAKADAPFADRRAEHEAFKAEQARRAVEKAAGETPASPLDEAPAVDGEGPRTVVVPLEAPPEEKSAETISKEAADRTIKALEEVEGAKEMLERTEQMKNETN